MKALEEQLGNALFTRVNRTLRLTHAGERLYRAVDEALALIDSAVSDVTGAGQQIAITTTVPFATLWLGPRLPAFARLHPGIGLRVAASNDNLDVERERIDLAIRYVPHGAQPPSSLKLCDYEMFPVCAPALDRAAPIRAPADLAGHVLLDFETVRSGRPWFDWQLWLQAKRLRGIKPAGSLRFSHYDLAVEAAIAGSGVAIGKWPYLANHLQKGTLVAPLGEDGIARLGAFYAVVSDRAASGVGDFVAWLQHEARRDDALRARLERPRRAARVASRRRAAVGQAR